MVHSGTVRESSSAGTRLALSHWIASLGEPFIPDASRLIVTVSEAAGRHLQVAVPSDQQRPGVFKKAECGVVFDGWLYNRDTLLTDLRLHLPPDTSDAAVALHAYLRWGEAALLKLKGIFALCIWDGRTKTLLCARDPLGVYPLFYARVGQSWLFSTSIDALLRHPGVPSTINRYALATYLLRQWRDTQETCFSSVRRIPPGHVLKLQPDTDTPRISRYWNPFSGGPVRWAREGEELEEFQDVMKGAIGRCLQLGRAGVYLSGGLDSGTIATLAAEYARENRLGLPHAVSVVHSEGEANEERIQRGIASNLGISQTLLPFDDSGDGDSVFFRALRANSTWPHPFALGLSPLHLTSGRQALEAGCDIVLSGEGGDEWLVPHHCLAADFMRNLDASRLNHMWRMTRDVARVPWYPAAKRVLWRSGLRPLLKQGRDRALQALPGGASRRRPLALSLPSWIAPDPQLRAVLNERAEEAARPASGSFYEREVLSDILDQPLTVLYKEDTFESSRRTGLLMLEPFYDPEVISFLIRLPPWLRTRGGRSKGLLRQFLHQRHPQLGYDRQRKPYATDVVATRVFEGAHRVWPAWQGAKALGELGVVDVPQMDASIAEILRSGDVHHTQRLWMALCAEAWARSRSGLV